MKKIIYLIMFLLMSNLYFSQNTNTNLTKVSSGYCFSEAQVNEIFNGLNQGEYLKVRLQKTEETLQNAKQVIVQQKDVIISKTEAITLKDEIIKQNQIACNADKESRKQFWKGIKIGGITVGVTEAVTMIYLLTK